MAPEVEDTSNPKTNRVDIWSLGCIMYQMLAGSPLFNSRREVWRYSDSSSSPPQAVRNRGFSFPCVDFLGDVLQPEPRDRPSAEDCLKKTWITNKTSGSGYSIGSDLYNRLTKILRAAPDIHSFSYMVADRAVRVHDSLLGGSTHNAGPPRAPRGQPAERHARTQPYVSNPTQWGNLGMDSVADSPRYFSGGPIFAGRCPRLLEVV